MSDVARKQTLVQLSEELLVELDALADRQRRSRSDLIREAIRKHLAAEREAEVDRQIVEAYSRAPQTQDELDWADHDSGFESPW